MLTTDRVAGAALTLLALGVVWESRKLPLGSLSRPGPAYMPVVLAAVLLVFGVGLAATGGGGGELAGAGVAPGGPPPGGFPGGALPGIPPPRGRRPAARPPEPPPPSGGGPEKGGGL